ncbi:MAG: hypothetical protein Q7S36_02775, partial [Candidatus Liptonbacteria bacterium]|nr:hypothetical protein [Candidatus Liptonbacteria bacterium]
FIDPLDGKIKFAVYEPVSPYGWGIVVERAAVQFFFMQNNTVAILTIISAFLALYCLFLIYLVTHRAGAPEKF